MGRCRIKPGELVHLNAYPGGASRPGEPPITSKENPIVGADLATVLTNSSSWRRLMDSEFEVRQAA